MATTGGATGSVIRKSVRVRAPVERAFRVFTAEFDSWWPRSHHIGNAPLKRAIIEGVVGGRCYGEQVDGTECDWGTTLVWDPPHRLVIAWQINADWTYQSDLSRSSEVEIRFSAESDGFTRVDLEHRNLERHGAGTDAMRTAVDGEQGWSALLTLYSARVEGPSSSAATVRSD